MSWKNWPYWLKGGVVGGVFSIVYYSLFSITQILMLNLGLGIIFYPLLPLVKVISIFRINRDSYTFVFSFLFLVFLYGFIIGAIIGFFIGKIKFGSKK